MIKYILVFFLGLTVSCQTTEVQKSIEMGKWGSVAKADNSVLEISNDRIILEFTCASATIDQFETSKLYSGVSLEGIYFNQFGTLPPNYNAEDYKFKALFTFTLAGEVLKVDIYDVKNNTKFGSFDYILNKNINIFKCA